MPALNANRLRQIQRTARSLRRLFIFIAILLVMGVLVTLTHPMPTDLKLVSGVAFQGAAVTRKIQILWIVQTVLVAAINLKAAYHLIRLLGLYAEGKLFTAQNVSQIRQLALTLMCAVVVWGIVLIGAIPEIGDQQQWVFVMRSFPLGTIVNGAVILFAGWIMNEGRELRDEQDLVI
jgi:hypothetical protein